MKEVPTLKRKPLGTLRFKRILIRIINTNFKPSRLTSLDKEHLSALSDTFGILDGLGREREVSGDPAGHGFAGGGNVEGLGGESDELVAVVAVVGDWEFRGVQAVGADDDLSGLFKIK